MATTLGKFLWKLRVDNDEILFDMSKKLGTSPSFLSSVENGKREFPSEWKNKICNLYKLTDKQKIEFEQAIATTKRITTS